MPKNHIFEYNTKPAKAGNKIFIKENEKVEKIADIVRVKGNYKCERSKLLIDIVIGRIFIAVTDKIMGTLHNKDTNFWVDEECNGCKLCEKICSVWNDVHRVFNIARKKPFNGEVRLQEGKDIEKQM